MHSRAAWTRTGRVGAWTEEHHRRGAGGRGQVHGPGIVANCGLGATGQDGKLQKIGFSGQVPCLRYGFGNGSAELALARVANDDRVRSALGERGGKRDVSFQGPTFFGPVRGAARNEEGIGIGQGEPAHVGLGPIEVWRQYLGQAGLVQLRGLPFERMQIAPAWVDVGV